MAARKKNPVDEFLVQVGDNIRRHRTRLGFTLEEVGRDIGVDKSSMHRIEMGRNITLVTLIKVAATLNIAASELLEADFKVVAEDVGKYLKQKKSSG